MELLTESYTFASLINEYKHIGAAAITAAIMMFAYRYSDSLMQKLTLRTHEFHITGMTCEQFQNHTDLLKASYESMPMLI